MTTNLTLTKNNEVAVEWEYIGEGFSGEYDPDDGDDQELLRFSVLQATNQGFGHMEWEQVEMASYCTHVPADTSDELLVWGLAYIMERVYEDVVAGRSVKRTCEDLSWMNRSHLANRDFHRP
jgi:hypothetical protein